MDLPRPGSLADAGAGSTCRPRGEPVKQLANVLRFGLPYLKRYLSRFTLGVVLGILFGASNVAFLWATDTLIKRMSVQTPALTAPGSMAGGSPSAPADRGLFTGGWRDRVQADLDGAVDPWLPRLGRSLDWRQVLGGLLLFPLLGAARGFIGYGSSYSMAWVSERVVNDLRVDVFQKISSLSMAFFNKSRVGDLITRVNGDTAALQKCLSLGVSDLIKEPVTVVSIVVGLFVIDWQLTLGVTVFFPLCVLPVIILGKKVRRAGKSGLAATISQSSLLVEMLEGIRVVKAFGLEGNQVERFRTLSREWIHHAMKGVRAKELVNPLIETISLLGFGILIVYIAARQISFSDMMVFLTGMAFIYTPVKKLAGLHVHFQQASVGVDRLVQILEEQPSVREPERPVPSGEFRHGLRFASIDFAYEQQQVLDRFTLEIPRGRKLGIAGESGSGKSTLVNLLFRFYDPTGGRIEMDGTDIRNFSLADLRSRMALVSQDVVLFDLTIAGNIACGRPGATREQIEAAAKAASAHEFILNLPQGYETRIGERGVTLSGGQRQRIAIARAFVRDAPILVLDEATAALDAHSEAEVQGAIQRLSENRTVICVAHRLSTLASMDRIIVLARGRIAEEGTFQELLAAGGLFTALAAAQQIRTPAGDGATGRPTTTP